MSAAPRLHLLRPGRDPAEEPAVPRCGIPVPRARILETLAPAIEALKHSGQRRGPICVLCLRELRDALESGEVEIPFLAPAPIPTKLGAREIGEVGAVALERARRGEEPRAKGWPSPEAAVRSYVRARAEGAALRSTSDPDRAHRVQLSRDPSLGGREHAVVDHHRTVALALSRAQNDAEGLRASCPALSPPQALDVYVLLVVGRAQLVPTRFGGRDLKGRWLDWIGYSAEAVVDHVADRAAVAITVEQLGALARHFTGFVREALLASGEMRSAVRERKEEDDARDEARAWDPLARLRERASG